MYFIAFLGFPRLFLNPFLKSYFLKSFRPIQRVRVCILLKFGTWKLFTFKTDTQSLFKTAFLYLTPSWTSTLSAPWALRILDEPF